MSTTEVLNPANASVLEVLPMGAAAEVEAAIDAAEIAFEKWRRSSLKERARILFGIADRIDAQRDELALLEARNVGKPIRDALDEIEMSAEVFRYYAGAIDKQFGESIPVDGGIDITFREPLGVVGVITPWNFPLAITCWNVAPALAAANTVIVKPSEITPLTALRLRAICLEAGLPPDVLQVVVGAGTTAGVALVESPRVAKISFTGSTAVGREVMARGAATIKKLTLELGGKAANIVFDDADLTKAARKAIPAVFGNCGQDCCSRARILVQASVYDEFLSELVAVARDWRVGDPEDFGTDMGPLVSAAHRDRVAEHVAGTNPIFQGQAPSGPGFWFPPTIVEVDQSHRLATEEVFGPVAALLRFWDEDDAIAMANATPYALSGSIWTGDVGRAIRVSRSVQAGTLSVNSNSSVRVSTPFGGAKQSGLGRELGMHGLDAYTELKNVFFSSERDN